MAWSKASRRSVHVIACLLLSTACSDDVSQSSPVGASKYELTDEQRAILGFERPTSDWFASSGTVGESSTVTQGQKSLAVPASGWTEITSVPLSSLGAVKSTLSLDMRAVTTPSWGEVRVVLVAPSLQLWWGDLGSRSLASLPAGQFTTLSFPLPGAIEAALEGTYSDLRIKVLVNGPVPASPYLIDNLDLAEASSGGPAPPATDEREFSVVIPRDQTRERVFLSASQYLQVDDRVEIGQSGELTNVSGLGTVGPSTHFGSALSGHTNVYSVGSVLLRSQSEVDGFVRSEGLIDEQDGTVVVHGDQQPNTDVLTRTYRWKVTFPTPAAAIPLVPANTDLTLDPGAYQALNVHGGRVFLRTGTYYFNTFSTEPPARVEVDTTAGPVFVYVRDTFTYKGPFVDQAPREGQLFVGYLGTTPAFLQAPFEGTMVAPNGQIALHRPTSGQHRGAFFAKQIQVFSDSHILHIPFDWNSFPTEEPRDTDGDGTEDPADVCVVDPGKTGPLLCGCNTSDQDDDGDTVPNCLDRCPQDPNKSHPGVCGCQNEDNLQPAGKPCVVEACAGSRQEGTCDGEGTCGPPQCAPIPGECFYKVLRSSLYWFCPSTVDWEEAEALCAEEPGRSLVKVDDSIEDLWIADVLGTSGWLGGNDLVRQDRWTWSTAASRSAVPFWVSGLPVPGRYENWSANKPGDGHCLTQLEDGTWSDADCASERAFVCEQPLLILPPFPDPVRACDFRPIPCGPDDVPTGPCVQESAEFPNTGDEVEDYRETQRITSECRQNCQSEGAPGCAEFCPAFATPVPAGLSCSGFSDREKAFCDLQNIHPTETCSLDDPTCPDGFTCGRRYECAALDAGFVSRPCSVDSECDAGHYCAPRLGVCIDPQRTTACDDRGPNDECVGQCFGSFACGQPEAVCAAFDDTEFLDRCTETLLCPDEGTTDTETNPLLDPNSNLTEQEFPVAQVFPVPEETPVPYPLAKPEGCGGENEPDCDFPVGEHPWCNYTIDPGERPEARSVSDSDPLFGDKQGTGGGAGPIRFDFDPNLTISYDIEEPLLPLGDGKFHARAEASATANAYFELFGIGGDVNILDARALVDAQRCGIEADARLALFGHDFLPALLGDDVHELLETFDTPQDLRDQCQTKIDEVVAVVERAQKAMRDAQELIRQQKALVDAGLRYRPNLCEELLGAASRGLPADFPSSGAPFVSCDGLSPEDTINLFIRYYREQVANLRAEHSRLIQESIPSLPVPLTIPFLDDIDVAGDVDESRRETQQIANINFTIGPIPMNLTVEAFVQYGIAGALNFSLTPGAVIETYNTNEPKSVADVDATVTPFAGAGVSLFLGVGFDFGPIAAKVGISGDVSLGLVSLPVYAGAGIRVQPEDDPRPLPEDLAGMVRLPDQVLYPSGPPKRYRFDAHFKFGANASISNILSGEIYGKLRIKFFFFSKTWKKQIAKFASPFDPINIALINGGGSAELADDFGILGAVRMPVPFVDFEELETPPPLPPLPDPTGGTGAGGSAGAAGSGGGGAGGAGGAGAGGEGNRPPVSLSVMGDPRYFGFDSGQVDQIFYDGYCDCASGPTTCRADLDCCDGSFCVLNDLSNSSTCVSCVAQSDRFQPGGQRCSDTSECCQSDPLGRNVLCYPLKETNPNSYCQACREQGEPVSDKNGDGIADFGECCGELRVYRAPINGQKYAAAPVCSGCRPEGANCNVDTDCCDIPGVPEVCDPATLTCQRTFNPPK